MSLISMKSIYKNLEYYLPLETAFHYIIDIYKNYIENNNNIKHLSNIKDIYSLRKDMDKYNVYSGRKDDTLNKLSIFFNYNIDLIIDHYRKHNLIP